MSQIVSNDNKPLPNDTPKRTSTFSMNRVLLKAKYSLYSALVFFLFANPETLIIIQKVFGNFVYIVTTSGVPTLNGILVSSLLFFITLLTLMIIPLD